MAGNSWMLPFIATNSIPIFSGAGGMESSAISKEGAQLVTTGDASP
jgi:hypothetical protein